MSHTTRLVVNRLNVKRYAAICGFGQAENMAEAKKWEPKSDLQRVFLRRVKDELQAQGVSESELTRRVGGPKQKTLNEVMRGRDPRLKTVEQIAKALGVLPPWKLLKDDEQTSGMPLTPKGGRKQYKGGDISQFPLGKTGRKGKEKAGRKE